MHEVSEIELFITSYITTYVKYLRNNLFMIVTAVGNENERIFEWKDFKEQYDDVVKTTQKIVIYSNLIFHDTLWALIKRYSIQR